MSIKQTIPAIGLLVLLGAGWFSFLAFYPRSYNTIHLSKRPGTQYWQLPGGSRIAYWHFPGTPGNNLSPIIYLHGGPGAGITDLEIVTLSKLTSTGHDIYLYDQVGCGHSSRLDNIQDYSAERHVSDLEEIVQQLKADKVILIGQSWGAILSTLYVASHPTTVEKLVITAPAAIQPANKKYNSAVPPDSLHLRAPQFQLKNNGMKTLRSRAMEFWVRTFESKLAGDEEADEYATFTTNELNKTMVCDSPNAVKATGTEGYYVHYMTRLSLGQVKDPRGHMKKYTAPVLVMKAQCDNQRWGYTQEYLDLFPHSTLKVVNDAGHNIFIEQPGRYVQIIEDFLVNVK